MLNQKISKVLIIGLMTLFLLAVFAYSSMGQTPSLHRSATTRRAYEQDGAAGDQITISGPTAGVVQVSNVTVVCSPPARSLTV